MNSDARTESAPKLKKSKNLNLFKNKYFIICLAVVIIAIIVVIILTALNNKPADGGESGEVVESANIYYNGSILTEADQEITKETLEKYADLNIKGHTQIEDETGKHDIVAVEVTNKSDQITSIAIDLAAKDNDGKTLDISSLYAEGITPGQTQLFNLFYYTELTPEQLDSAKYEVYKAYTYESPNITEQTESDTITEENTEE